MGAVELVEIYFDLCLGYLLHKDWLHILSELKYDTGQRTPLA